jgi:hypothetical protein
LPDMRGRKLYASSFASPIAQKMIKWVHPAFGNVRILIKIGLGLKPWSWITSFPPASVDIVLSKVV